MAAGKPIVEIEGERELTAALAALESKMQRKVLPKAAKAASKIVSDDYKQNAPVDSGAMRASVRTRLRRYKHKAATGKMVIARGGHMKGKMVAVQRVVAEDIGAQVYIDGRALKKQVGKRATGAVQFHYVKGKKGKLETRVHFYPSIIELGAKDRAGQRPLTKALYTNDDSVRQKYLTELQALIAQAGGP